MTEMRERIDAEVRKFRASFGHMPRTVWVGREEWKQFDCQGYRLHLFYVDTGGFIELVVVPTPSEHFFGISSIPYKV